MLAWGNLDNDVKPGSGENTVWSRYEICYQNVIQKDELVTMTGTNDPTLWNIKTRKISDGIQIYEANEPEKLEPYPGFHNYFKITVRDHIRVSPI